MLNHLFVIAMVIFAVTICIRKYTRWRESNRFLYITMLAFLAFAGGLFGQTIEWARNGWGNSTIQKLIFVEAFGKNQQIWGIDHMKLLFVMGVFLVATIFVSIGLMRIFSKGRIGQFFSAIAPWVVPVVVIFFSATTGAHLKAANVDISPFSEAAADVAGQGVINASMATADVAGQITDAAHKKPQPPPEALANIRQAEDQEIQSRMKQDEASYTPRPRKR